MKKTLSTIHTAKQMKGNFFLSPLKAFGQKSVNVNFSCSLITYAIPKTINFLYKRLSSKAKSLAFSSHFSRQFWTS